MTKQERKVILTGAGIVIVALLIVLTVNGVSKERRKDLGKANTPIEQNIEKYVTNLEDGTKLNNSKEFNKTKRYKNIEISNIQFTYENGRSVLLANVKNTASTKHQEEIIKLTILGDNNEVIDVLEPTIPMLEAGESRQFNVIITGKDAVNARDFRIEEKK